MSDDNKLDTMQKRIQYARSKIGITSAELARRVGISKQAMAAIEKGATKTPGADVALNLAEQLGVSVPWILHGDVPAPGGAVRKMFEDARYAGEMLRRLRLDAGLSIAHVADAAGLSAAAVDDVERGASAFIGADIEAVGRVLGVDRARLFARPGTDMAVRGSAIAEAPHMSQAARPDLETLRSAIAMVESALEELGIDYPAATKAQIIVAVYAGIEASGEAAAARDVVATMLKTVSQTVKT